MQAPAAMNFTCLDGGLHLASEAMSSHQLCGGFGHVDIDVTNIQHPLSNMSKCDGYYSLPMQWDLKSPWEPTSELIYECVSREV